MKATSAQRVLVIGDDTRSFLATVRSLGRRGLQVHAAPYGLNSPALRSRYIHKTHLLPYYLDGGAAWLARMRQLIQDEGIDLVIPCEERSLLPLYRHRDALPQHCVLAIPNEASLQAFFDKVQTRRLAEAQQVPVTQGYELDADSTAAQVAAKLAFPVIAKYRQSYSWPELYVRTGVTILKSEAELQRWLQANRERLGQMFVEQMFAGIGVGVSVLCDRGQVLQAFEHHRAHELDGSSYYRKSAPLDKDRLAAVARMCAAVGYTGLAMFEFKLDPARGDWVLLEVNARPWGSLPLPVALGVDFPYRLYQLLCQHQATPSVAYRSGIYGRNLIADIWQLRAWLPRLRHRKWAMVGRLLSWLGSLGRVLIGREHHDVLVLDDWRPAVVEMRQFVAERWQGLRGVPPLARNPAFGADGNALRRTHGAPLKIVFVCQGNICRSPYAEHKARALAAAAGLPLQLASAGMLPRNRRPSPAVALAVAARRGVPLDTHHSQHAHEDLLQQADAIVIFDAINRRSVLARYPEAATRLCYLDEFSQDHGPVHEIADPDGRADAVFDATYDHIDRALQGLMTRLQAKASHA
jgi:protein-tyrosine-phosphatase/predicted ATP-grasp superfamily ATP-dependent carboligase